MLENTLSEKLVRILAIANDRPAVGAGDCQSTNRRLVNLMERKVPAFWRLDVGTLAEIFANETGPVAQRIMNAEAEELGLAISSARPAFEARYLEPEHQERLRKRNTPFEELIEQQHAGFMTHVEAFMELLEGLGLSIDYILKRKTDSVTKLHSAMFASVADGGNNVLRVFYISEEGHIIAQSNETGSAKLAYVKYVANLSKAFASELQFTDEEGLFTNAEVQSLVLHRGFPDLYEAISSRPNFAPFVAVDLLKVLPRNTDRFLDFVKALLVDIEQPSELESAIRSHVLDNANRLRIMPINRPFEEDR